MNNGIGLTETMRNGVAARSSGFRFVFSAEQQKGLFAPSQDTDVVLISLASNSLDFLSPSSPPQLKIAFPLKQLCFNRSHLSLFLAADTSGMMHFMASFQRFPNSSP